MSVARHGTGIGATARAFASQVHPVFMLPPIAAAWFGAILAPTTRLGPVIAVATGTFFAVYTAHIKDGYVDFHVRGEDDDHPLTGRGCRLGLTGAAVGFAASLVALAVLSGPRSAAVLAPTWAIGYLHAPTLDTNPVTATAGYPVGVATVIVAGHRAQAGEFAPVSIAFAAVFLVLLCGVKVIDDMTDYEYDRTIDKHTVAVVLGPDRARRLGHALLGAGLLGIVAFTIDGILPPAAPLSIPAFAAVALLAARAEPKTATMLLVRGTYLLLAGLMIAVAIRPLAGVSLPDIGVLGPYTYLTTEAVFGAIALGLLYRAGAGALGRAVTTVAALYPVAYVWDWYTLEVGVFAVELRTGVELVGIPIEEHLFAVVVPALVLALHETLHGPTGGDRTAATGPRKVVDPGND